MDEERKGLFTENGSKRGVAYVASGLGDLFKAEGNLAKARQQHAEALAVRRGMGERAEAAESQVALGDISLEEGHAADAEAPVREALEIFHRQKLSDDELAAHLVLARAVLSLGKKAGAQKEVGFAGELVARSQSRDARLNFSIVAARVRAASGRPADLFEAARTLNALAEATRYGFVGYQFEAGLSLGEMEAKSGPPRRAAGRARLQALAKDATAEGFLLIARKAAAALGQQPLP